MLQSLLAQFHIDSTDQLRNILERFGHFLSPENHELVLAIINEVDKGEDMNIKALGAAATYLSSGISSNGQTLKTEIDTNHPALKEAIVAQLQATPLTEEDNANEYVRGFLEEYTEKTSE